MVNTVGGSIVWDLDIDDKKLNAGLADARKKVGDAAKEIDKSFTGAAKSITNSLEAAKGASLAFAAGLAAVGAAVVTFGVSSVKAYQESENSLAQLNAVLKSTGGIAGVSAKEATDLAASLQKVSVFSDESVLGAENMLLTFTNISKTVFPQATQTVLDMSQALGQDLKSSSIQLGKALQDPILGVTALRRVGVNFNDDQKEMIKTLVESGRTLDAQKLILKELNTEFGGSASAAAKTFTGQIAIAKNTFNDFQELIGKAITERLTPLVQAFNDWFAAMGGPEGLMAKFTNEIFPAFEHYLPIITGLIIGGLTPAMFALGKTIWFTVIPAMIALLPYIVIGGLIGAAVMGIIELFKHWGDITAFFGNIFTGVTTSIKNAWNAMGSSLSNTGKKINSTIQSVKDVFVGLMAVIVDFFTGGDVTATWWQHFRMNFMGVAIALDNFQNAIITTFENIVSFFQELPGRVAQFFLDLPKNIIFSLGYALGTIVNWVEAVGRFFTVTLPEFIDATVAYFKALPGRIGAALTEAYITVTTWASNTGTAMATSASSWIENTVAWFKQLPGRIGAALTDLFLRFVTWGNQTGDFITSSVTNWITNIVNWFKELPGRIANALSNMGNSIKTSFSSAFNAAQSEVQGWPGRLYDWGKSIADSFVNGIKNGLKGVRDAFISGFNAARGAIEGHSPPKEGPLRNIDTWGFNIGEAWIKGVQSAVSQFQMPQFSASVEMNARPSLAPMDNGGGSNAPAGGGQIITIHIDKVDSKADIDSLIHELGYRTMLSPEYSI